MLVPALIYAAINFEGPNALGWGIPMATDIALAVGIMTLARNVKPALKLFVLALAIVDDIGAILVIGIFYSGEIDPGWIGAALDFVALVLVMQKARVDATWLYVVVGGGLWLAFDEAGIHATLSGVILGLLAPAKPYRSPELIDQTELTNRGSEDVAETARLARSAVSVVEWLEHRLHPWTSFLIVPLSPWLMPASLCLPNLCAWRSRQRSPWEFGRTTPRQTLGHPGRNAAGNATEPWPTANRYDMVRDRRSFVAGRCRIHCLPLHRRDRLEL